MARPPKDEALKKGAQISVRIPIGLRERLERARRQGDAERSLNQEIEMRLRLSFEGDAKIKDQFGVTNFWLFKAIARQIGVIERFFTYQRWYEDPYTFGQVKLLIDTFMDHFRPAGRATTPTRFRKKSFGDNPLGKQLALKELASIVASINDPFIDGYPRNPDGALKEPYPPAGTVTGRTGRSGEASVAPKGSAEQSRDPMIISPWPNAGEWFAAAGVLKPKMKKDPLAAYLQSLAERQKR